MRVLLSMSFSLGKSFLLFYKSSFLELGQPYQNNGTIWRGFLPAVGMTGVFRA